MYLRYDFLKGLVQGTLSNEEIVKGYIKFYVLRNRTFRAAEKDLIRFARSQFSAGEAVNLLKMALVHCAEGENSQPRIHLSSLDEPVGDDWYLYLCKICGQVRFEAGSHPGALCEAEEVEALMDRLLDAIPDLCDPFPESRTEKEGPVGETEAQATKETTFIMPQEPGKVKRGG